VVNKLQVPRGDSVQGAEDLWAQTSSGAGAS